MKKILFLIIAASVVFSSCKKEEETKTTKVEIIVKDAVGVKPNFTVYQISDTKYNLYGTDEFFRDQQSVTNSSGIATFTIDELEFATGGQNTYYFFTKYSIGGVNKVKSVGVTLSKGDSKSEQLFLN